MADGTTGAGLEARNVAGAMTTMRLDELVANLAIGIARGQMALDQACMDIAQFMSQAQVAFGKRPGSDEPDLMSLIELGFTPNFYQFVDTVLELRVAVSTKFEEKREEDTSLTRLQTNAVEQQAQYQSQQQSSYGVGGSGWGVGWGLGSAGGYSYGYGYSGSQSSQAGASSSFQSKTIDMATVDAKYASTYNYAVEASSVVKTKIVPVPPPPVFEEIVRAKLKERREWEKRLRLTEEAKAIFIGQKGAVDSMLAKLSEITSVANSDNKNKAAALYESATKLQESHGSLTNEHWALTGSVSDRAAADARMSAILARAADLRTFFDAGTGPDPAETNTALQGELAGYKEIVDSLLQKLAATGATTPSNAPAVK